MKKRMTKKLQDMLAVFEAEYARCLNGKGTSTILVHTYKIFEEKGFLPVLKEKEIEVKKKLFPARY